MHSRPPRSPAGGAREHGTQGALLGDLSSPSHARLSAHLWFTRFTPIHWGICFSNMVFPPGGLLLGRPGTGPPGTCHGA